MRKIIAIIIAYFVTIPKIVMLEIRNFEHHLKQFSEVEKRAMEQRKIIDLIKTLDIKKEDIRMALNGAAEGNYQEVITALIWYINKYTK